MTLTLVLPPGLEQRLKDAAARRAIEVDKYALEVLEANVSAQDKRRELMTLLQSWMGEGEDEPDDDSLYRAIDEDRLSDRPLFPPEMKGITW